MNKRSFGKTHAKFLIIAVIIMVLSDRYIFDGTRPYIEQTRQEAKAKGVEEFQEALSNISQESSDLKPKLKIKPAVPEEKKEPQFAKLKTQIKITEPSAEKYVTPLWQRNKVDSSVPNNVPRVIIVIDDLGVNAKYTKEIMSLEAPLTLAFLPYAKNSERYVKEARKNGHEILIHMPMEPMNSDLDTGDVVLKTEQSRDEFVKMLDTAMNSFDGYIGINNHMGSKLTQSAGAMNLLMSELKKRGLAFLDSKTIASSIAAKTAQSYEVPYAERDVFLDHDSDLEAVIMSLQRLEELALKHGHAIAIGHPKKNTIKALQEWLPTLEDKGLSLVPLSSVLVVNQPSASLDARSQSQVQPHQ